MEPECLSLEHVRFYMQFRGGKVANHELVKHFKRYLNEPHTKESARLLFKDIVNTIATVQKEGNQKYLVLKPSYINENEPIGYGRDQLESPEPTHSIPEHFDFGSPVTSHIETPIREDVEIRRAQIAFQPTPTQDDHQDTITPNVSMDDSSGLLSPPRPPPRRKPSNRGKENMGTKIEEKVRQLHEERDTTSPPNKSVQREEELLELSLSPGIVKERADKLNKMASTEVDTKCLVSPSSNILSSSASLNSLTGTRRHKHADDDDSSSVTTLDPRSKEWVIKAAKGDYHALAKLLKEDPKLAGFKDFISGFTALHWAAKHGNSDMVKLIAGSQKINPNCRSHGGYTPLHIAAHFRHEEIMELLVNTYGADPSLRDHSGKRPHQYLPSTPYACTFYASQAGAVGLPGDEHRQPMSHHNANNKTNGTWSSTEAAIHGAFTRIGSLNSKVRKTAASVIHGSSNTSSSKKTLARIKSWGSADSLQPTRQQSSNSLMPPPKHPPKKKKYKRGSADLTSLPSEVSKKAADSDSDGGFAAHGF